MSSWAWKKRSTALVVLGWMALVAGALVNGVWARLLFLTASRVLPQTAAAPQSAVVMAPRRGKGDGAVTDDLSASLPLPVGPGCQRVTCPLAGGV